MIFFLKLEVYKRLDIAALHLNDQINQHHKDTSLSY